MPDLIVGAIIVNQNCCHSVYVFQCTSRVTSNLYCVLNYYILEYSLNWGPVLMVFPEYLLKDYLGK